MLLGAAALAAQAQAQVQTRSPHPADHWEFAVESGWLAKVRDNSPHEYRIVPVQAVWRSPVFAEVWRGAAGERLVLRHRLALVSEFIRNGPEDYYVAFAGAPSLQLWSADGRQAAFLEVGGGAGFVNSKGVPGGQGQDLSFNWFAHLGWRRQLDARLGVTAGAYFTHHSNLGMTDPNPGIDVLGLNIGVVWTLD
ncbi:acyloxyacyl hydrolase [Ramlibacter sp. AW1]|uniref:Acyloxyacyl hydrolase n=2 Tax=Ramlibacter aurantiacus TaxID=2801330 RepID=A0A936ZMG6_9BURK|nr:acyloxyacyl hydrolase [Ramlibacter aurantiacus]